MNIYEIIQKEMLSDDEDTDDISKDLKNLYKKSTKEQKKIIDIFCNCLTGWSFKTLLEQEGNQLIDKAIDKALCNDCYKENKEGK